MEYLYVPCSFLEQHGARAVEATPAGVVELIPVRVNANLKTKTARYIYRTIHYNVM